MRDRIKAFLKEKDMCVLATTLEGTPHCSLMASMANEDRRRLTADEMKAQREEVKRTLCCPNCGQRMKKWVIPDSPFNTWQNEYMYICFNDECPYLVRGWDVMSSQGNASMSYRQMFNPENDSLTPMPVPNLRALKDGIMEEE